MRRYALTLLLLSLTVAIRPQILTLRNFTNMEYNGGTQNWAVDQSADKRMLFANNYGLLTYDGDHWNIYPVPNYTNVRSTLFDKEKDIAYVGATDEFGYFKRNTDNSKMEYHSLSTSLRWKYKKYGEIWKILRVGNETAFQSKDHVFILHGNGKITPHDFHCNIDNTSVVDGKLYISCKEKIYVYSQGKVTVLPASEALEGKAVAAVLPYGNNLLFATVADGLYIYDNKEIKPFVLDITPMIVSSQIFCAAVYNGYLAIGTIRGGVVIKDIRTGENHYANALTGLQNNTVLSMRFDGLGNLWLGLDNGIAYVMLNTPYRDLYGIGNNIGTGYASLRHGDRLYLGTNQGLFVMPLPLSSNTPVPPRAQSVNGISGQVWSVRDIGGEVLVGVNDGAFVVKGTTATRIPGLRGTWGFMELRDTPGYILGCDYNGLFILSSEGGSYHIRNRIANGGVSSGQFEQDNDGSVWMSHWQNGIYRFRLDSGLRSVAHTSYYHKGNGLPMDNDNLICKIKGMVYVSSVDGFRKYNPRTGKLDKCEWLNKVFNTYGTALRVVETPSGDLWAYKPGYLAVARRQKDGTYKAEQLAYLNMVKRLQMSLGHVGFLDNGHTLLNYDNGFYIVDNNFRVGKREGNNLVIRSIHSTNNKDSLLYAAAGYGRDKIVVPHSLNSLRIEFVMPEYRDQNGVEYSCYLENYDKQWVGPQSSSTKEYTKLSKGNYVFHVKARNLVDGVEREASIEIVVLPAWYETWWAYIIYILAVCLTVYLVIRHLKRMAERELRRVKKEQERQMREQQQQIREQQLRFTMDEERKEKEIIKLRNDHLEVELKHKSSELADNAINLVRKNDMLQSIDTEMEELLKSVRTDAAKITVTKKISDIRRNIRTHMMDDSNWDKFEENFNLVYDNFTQKLMARYTDLKKIDLKLCVYLRMGLSSKEMASLLNTSVRSIETARYRLRKKLNLESGDNLIEFIQSIDKDKVQTEN